jgi:hypothetical protein
LLQALLDWRKTIDLQIDGRTIMRTTVDFVTLRQPSSSPEIEIVDGFYDEPDVPAVRPGSNTGSTVFGQYPTVSDWRTYLPVDGLEGELARPGQAPAFPTDSVSPDPYAGWAGFPRSGAGMVFPPAPRPAEPLPPDPAGSEMNADEFGLGARWDLSTEIAKLAGWGDVPDGLRALEDIAEKGFGDWVLDLGSLAVPTIGRIAAEALAPGAFPSGLIAAATAPAIFDIGSSATASGAPRAVMPETPAAGPEVAPGDLSGISGLANGGADFSLPIIPSWRDFVDQLTGLGKGAANFYPETAMESVRTAREGAALDALAEAGIDPLDAYRHVTAAHTNDPSGTILTPSNQIQADGMPLGGALAGLAGPELLEDLITVAKGAGEYFGWTRAMPKVRPLEAPPPSPPEIPPTPPRPPIEPDAPYPEGPKAPAGDPSVTGEPNPATLPKETAPDDVLEPEATEVADPFEVPRAVLENQAAQERLVANQQERLQAAIRDGGARAKGKVLAAQGAEAEAITGRTIREIEGTTMDTRVKVKKSGVGREIDFRVKRGNNTAYVESKYSISKIYDRTIKHLTNAVEAAESGDLVILQVARAPTDPEILNLKNALGRTATGVDVYSRITIISKQTELYNVLDAGLH